MEKKIAVIGGDMRTVYLANMLSKENTVITYGQEQANIKTNAMKIDNLKTAVEISDIIIGPIPFSKDGEYIYTLYSNDIIPVTKLIEYCKEKTLISGAIPTDIHKMCIEKNIKLIDLMKNESLSVLNTIATAEGALKIAIEKKQRTIHGSRILVLGYGRVAKVVAKKFAAIGAKVACAARKSEALAWIEVNGYEELNINELGENLSEFDIILNTPPAMILTRERLKMLKKDCLVIDLASNPGGVDFNAAEELGISYEWALGLPGKVAPITAAEHIKKVLDELL